MEMSMDRARSFLLMTYHDLPNILLVGSLFFGILSGYLPLVWVGLGMVVNWLILYLGQVILGLLFDKGNDTLVYKNTSLNCSYGFKVWQSLAENRYSPGDRQPVAPSFWMGSAFFFSIFCIYNSFRVMFHKGSDGATQEMKDNRQAYTISTVVIGFVFFGLIIMRGMTGCETWFGGLTAFLLSGGLAISYWHLLDSCGGGRIPDILQVIGSLAPDASTQRVPVVCSVEAFKNSEKDTAKSVCAIYKELVKEFLAFAQEFSNKSPESSLDKIAFDKKNSEMAAKFASFKEVYANKHGLGSKPNESCLFKSEKDQDPNILYNKYLEAQQRMKDAGWVLGV